MAVRVPDLETPKQYPWDQWLDGSTWSARQGKDFDVEPNVFRSYLYEVARKNGTTVTTRTEGKRVTFKFASINNKEV